MGKALKKTRNEPAGTAELRRSAEKHLKAKPLATDPSPKASPEELLQELQIHQIELEMQNEELLRLRNETEVLLAEYLDIYDFAPVGYFTLGPDGVILRASLTGARLIEVERAGLIGRNLRNYVTADSFFAFDAFVRKTFSGWKIETCEIELSGKGKTPPRVVQLEGRLSADSRECRLAMIDVTERRQAEAELHRYELLASYSRDIILFLGRKDRRILEANVAATEAYGYPREELIGMSIFDLLTSDAIRLTPTQLDEADGRGLLFESRYRRRDGSAFPAEVSMRGATFDGRRILINVIRDITKRKAAETALEEQTRQLESANRELESFSYSVSHDLRAPLRAIDGYARMILKKQQEHFDQDTRDKFNVIRSNIRIMGDLIDDLLKFSHLGRAIPSMVKLDLEGLIREAWGELQRVNPDRRMTLRVDKLPPGMGDSTLVRQVIGNLLSNAVKFTRIRETALIDVGGYRKEDECLYFVRDNGVGFNMAYRNKLYVVFQRLHSDEEYEGTGIGLALVQRIINRHGGRAWAEGEEDRGATFYFSLPAPSE